LAEDLVPRRDLARQAVPGREDLDRQSGEGRDVVAEVVEVADVGEHDQQGRRRLLADRPYGERPGRSPGPVDRGAPARLQRGQDLRESLGAPDLVRQASQSGTGRPGCLGGSHRGLVATGRAHPPSLGRSTGIGHPGPSARPGRRGEDVPRPGLDLRGVAATRSSTDARSSSSTGHSRQAAAPAPGPSGRSPGRRTRTGRPPSRPSTSGRDGRASPVRGAGRPRRSGHRRPIRANPGPGAAHTRGVGNSPRSRTGRHAGR
jgi:hypothetical protein